MMQSIPTISQAFSLLLQEESQREFAKLSQSPHADSMALTVKYNNLSKFKNTGQSTTSFPQKKQSSDAYCDYCNTAGHVREKCFCLHGYPDWHKLYGKPKPKPRKPYSSQAPASVLKSAAQVSTQLPVAGSTENSTDSVVKQTMPFTDAQCQQLSKMIQDSIRQTQNWSMNPSTSQMTGNLYYSRSTVTVHSVITLDNSQSHLDLGFRSYQSYYLS